MTLPRTAPKKIIRTITQRSWKKGGHSKLQNRLDDNDGRERTSTANAPVANAR